MSVGDGWCSLASMGMGMEVKVSKRERRIGIGKEKEQSGRREKGRKETRCWKRSGNWEWNGKEKESVAWEWNRERKAWEGGSGEWLGSGNSMVVAIRSQGPRGKNRSKRKLPVSGTKDRYLVNGGWMEGRGKKKGVRTGFEAVGFGGHGNSRNGCVGAVDLRFVRSVLGV